jgi:hypothetical protein
MNANVKPDLNVQSISAANVPITNPNGISPVYANSVGAAGTLTDFSLFFLETGQIPGESGPIARNELKSIVTLPMGIARPLIEVLQQIIGSHEAITKVSQKTASEDERVRQ